MKAPDAKKLRQVLKSLGNPYAFIEYEEDLRIEEQASPAPDAVASMPLRHLQNPYATLYYKPPSSTDDAPPAEVAMRLEANVSDISRTEFRRRCASIFRRYVPKLEGRNLREHYKEFILRNEGRPGRLRSLLVAALEKYDLSTTPGIAPQFNREGGGFSEEKLRKIEERVLRTHGG